MCLTESRFGQFLLNTKMYNVSFKVVTDRAPGSLPHPSPPLTPPLPPLPQLPARLSQSESIKATERINAETRRYLLGGTPISGN